MPNLTRCSIMTLLLAGCGSMPAQEPENQQARVLRLADLDGAWTFSTPATQAVECYFFRNGFLVSYSSFCDGINDLVNSSVPTIDGNRFSMVFTAFIQGVGATGQTSFGIEGTITDSDTITAEFTATPPGGAFSISIRGTLSRDR